MKKTLIFLFLISGLLNAQIVRDSITGYPEYKKINAIKLSQEEIKLHSNSWIIENFNNTNDGIKLNSEKK